MAHTVHTETQEGDTYRDTRGRYIQRHKREIHTETQEGDTYRGTRGRYIQRHKREIRTYRGTRGRIGRKSEILRLSMGFLI